MRSRQLDDRVAHRLAEPLPFDRAERRAILDDPSLAAVVPDEGIPWPSGPLPVAIELRQTGVTDGKTLTPRV